MADTVKVQAMRKLEDVLRAIPEIGSVHRWQGTAVDLDQVRLPALFIVEEEEARERRNRLAVGVLKMNLQVFIRLTPAGAALFNDVADNLQGKIHNALINTALFKGLVENIQEGLGEDLGGGGRPTGLGSGTSRPQKGQAAQDREGMSEGSHRSFSSSSSAGSRGSRRPGTRGLNGSRT